MAAEQPKRKLSDELQTLDAKIPLVAGIPYGIQHILAMFVANLAPIAIVAAASGIADATTLIQSALLTTLAQSVTRRVYPLSTADRKYLHLSAVWACNFVNHCYDIAAGILAAHHLPFDVMLPLIDETARKVHSLSPHDAQTGPAVRYDENVIAAQSALMADDPELQQLYELLSKSIHRQAKHM